MPDLARTISLAAAVTIHWDLVIVGAGPAGSMAAARAASAGARVLLVDRDVFPRPKVCGCCLNASGLAVLERAGLGDLPGQLGAVPLRDFRLSARGRTAALRLPHGVVVSRERFDAALIAAAIDRGAQFLDSTRAQVADFEGSARQVQLRDGDSSGNLLASGVVVASGLGTRSFAGRDADDHVIDAASRIGAGAVIEVEGHDRRPGQLEMAVARDGYAGLVVLEDGRLDVAAALDASALRGRAMGQVVADILRRAGVSVPAGLQNARWTGTPWLTQRRAAVHGPRYFVVGDAAGYVEPFTGEGMSWALATGLAVVPIALARTSPATAGREWARTHRHLLARRQRSCRYVSRLLRREALTTLGVRILAHVPALAGPVVRALNKPFGVMRVT